MKALILCAGLGTRLQPLTYTTPKSLMPVAGRPVLAYLLDDLRLAGVSDIGIVVDGLTSPIVAYATPEAFPESNIRFVVQSRPLGLAHAVRTGRAFLRGDPFIVCLGDCFAPGGVPEVLAAHRSLRPAATVAVRPVADPTRFGVAEVVDGQVRSFEEKPDKPRSDLAIAGLYAFEPEVLQAIDRAGRARRNPCELTDVLQTLVEQGRAVSAPTMSCYWRDIGRVEDLLSANAHCLERLPARSDGIVRDCLVTGNVLVGQDSRVRASVLHGPIAIGRGCRVSGSSVGPFTTVGDGCEIADSEISGSIVMRDCRLEGVRIADGSVIGNRCGLRAGLGSPLRATRLVLGDGCTVRIEDDGMPRIPGDGRATLVPPTARAD